MAQELPPVSPGEVIESGTFGNPVLQRLVDRGTRAAQAGAGAGVEGDLWYVTDENKLEIYDGAAWQPLTESVLAGSGITVSGAAPDFTVAHGDTSSVADKPFNEQFVNAMTFDTYGHVQTLGVSTIPRNALSWGAFGSSGANIGNGVVAVSVPNVALPADGLVQITWMCEVVRTAGGSTPADLDNLSFVLRRDGSNVDPSGWIIMNTFDQARVLTFFPDDGGTNGWTFTGSFLTQWGAGVPTNDWDLFVAKTGNDTYSVRRRNMTVTWIRS